jgi:hypothetical protein
MERGGRPGSPPRKEKGIVEGEEQLTSYITKYYKNLFGKSQVSSLTLNESLVEDIRQITNMESETLVADFSEKEVRGSFFK